MPLHFKENNTKELGQYLRNIRRNKNLTISEVSKKTKIKSHYLEAIEQDRIDKLIEMTYARINVLKYGRFLNTDMEKLMSMFEQQYLFTETATKRKHRNKKEKKRNKKWIISSKILSIFAVLIIVGGLFFLGLYINEHLNLQRDILKQGSENIADSMQADSVVTNLASKKNRAINFRNRNYLKDFVIEENNNIWYRKPVYLKNQEMEYGITN